MWVQIQNKQFDDVIYLCVCYLPPDGSSRHNDGEQFYRDLMSQVYLYQNRGRILICGDFNSRIGNESDFIEGVDNIILRDCIDSVSNKYGDFLLDFLIDCNLCSKWSCW